MCILILPEYLASRDGEVITVYKDTSLAWSNSIILLTYSN